jgi:hypothetical protein
MEKQSSSTETKLQPVNSAYVEIIEFLKSGGEKIKKDLRKSRQIKFCREIQMARKRLKTALKSAPDYSKARQVQILFRAIQNVIYQLKQTQRHFHSKELQRIREYAENLLTEVKNKYKNKQS